MSLGAVGTSFAEGAQIQFDSMTPDITFHNKAGDLLSSYDGINYVASFWFGLTEAAMKPIGFGDLVDGTVCWFSDPKYPVEFDATNKGYLSIKIFVLDSSYDSHFINEGIFDTWSQGYKAADLSDPIIANLLGMFNAKPDGSEWGEWTSVIYAKSSGSAGDGIEQFMDSGAFKAGGEYHLDKVAGAVPEPSTWLLLGAGAAFIVILRRKKKDA